MKHSGLVAGAARNGQAMACVKSLEDLAQDASWYAADRTRLVDGKAFNKLREYIDQAEELWKAANPQAMEEGKV